MSAIIVCSRHLLSVICGKIITVPLSHCFDWHFWHFGVSYPAAPITNAARAQTSAGPYHALGGARVAGASRPLDNNAIAKCLIHKHFQSLPGLFSSISDNKLACSAGRAGLV